MFLNIEGKIKVIRQLQFIFVNALLLLFSGSVVAYQVGVEFSADAIQVAPGRSPIYSKMFVSKKAVRTEMMQQGVKYIDISYLNDGKRVFLNPQQKTYMEQTGLVVTPSWSGKKAKTPCEGIPGASCKKLGNETIQGINTEKWQVERKVNNKSYRSLHWIDSKRRLAIKEMLPDGGVTELVMLGKDDLNGRQVERWESRSSHPSGKSQVSRQWYDLQLKIVIREEMEGGYLRELSNIKVANQDKSLFRLPDGYKKISNNMSGTNKANNQGKQK